MKPKNKLIQILTAVTALIWGTPVSAGPDAKPRILGVFIEEDVVVITIDLKRSFGLERMKFVSKKSFPNDPPWFPPTHHELTFGHFEVGTFEWFQFDYIMIGEYELVDDFTVNASVIGKQYIGVFDPKSSVLTFDGLDYKPFLKTPSIIVKASKDLKKWRKVSNFQEVPKEYKWPESLSFRFKWNDPDHGFFVIGIEDD